MPLPQNSDPNLHSLAAEAIRYAREVLPLGSCNKKYGISGPIPENKREKYTERRFTEVSQAHMRALQHELPPTCSKAEMLAHGREIIKYGVGGNCESHAVVAYVFLERALRGKTLRGKEIPLNVGRLAHPGNHYFVVAGYALGHMCQLYLRNLGAWPTHAMICDPWIDWTGPGYQYSHFYNEKMYKWEARQMTIGRHPPTTLLDTVLIHEKIAWIRSKDGLEY